MYNNAQIHFICRNFEGIERDGALPNYSSRAWSLTEEVALQLIGAQVFFHEMKAETSYFGGTINRIERLPSPDNERVILYFSTSPTARGVKWQGADHAMAWSSGLVYA